MANRFVGSSRLGLFTKPSPKAGATTSDRRLKENIVPMGQENGHNIYAYNYIGDDRRYIGVMADEVFRTNPEAVTTLNGYLAVYYDKIGVRFREI